MPTAKARSVFYAQALPGLQWHKQCNKVSHSGALRISCKCNSLFSWLPVQSPCFNFFFFWPYCSILEQSTLIKINAGITMLCHTQEISIGKRRRPRGDSTSDLLTSELFQSPEHTLSRGLMGIGIKCWPCLSGVGLGGPDIRRLSDWHSRCLKNRQAESSWN